MCCGLRSFAGGTEQCQVPRLLSPPLPFLVSLRSCSLCGSRRGGRCAAAVARVVRVWQSAGRRRGWRTITEKSKKTRSTFPSCLIHSHLHRTHSTQHTHIYIYIHTHMHTHTHTHTRTHSAAHPPSSLQSNASLCCSVVVAAHAHAPSSPLFPPTAVIVPAEQSQRKRAGPPALIQQRSGVAWSKAGIR